MDKPRVPPDWEENAREILHVLDLHWHRRYCPEEIRGKVRELLKHLEQVLDSDSADARFLLCTYRRLLGRDALPEELELANRVMQRMVAELSGDVVSVLPFSFITLPNMLALARHLGVDLLPEPGESQGKEDTSCISYLSQ